VKINGKSKTNPGVTPAAQAKLELRIQSSAPIIIDNFGKADKLYCLSVLACL
jgi:hypothetical protein